ncbi:5796_t:CDS:2, partial [Funneliformis caledonium]
MHIDELYKAELVVDIQSFASASNSKEVLAKYGEEELNILSEFYKKK